MTAFWWRRRKNMNAMRSMYPSAVFQLIIAMGLGTIVS